MPKNTINKNIIPEGFTIKLALFDLLPVLFFGASGVLLGVMLDNIFVIICAILVFLSGFIKALWKIIVAKKKKNIWWMFKQMRIMMPVAYVGLIVAIIISLITHQSIHISLLWGFPQIIFFILGILGMIGMIVCAKSLDSSNAKSNWLEQGINSLAQLCFLVGLICMYLS